jgi:ATP-dependent Clp protease ATP-binding subunit ClpA
VSNRPDALRSTETADQFLNRVRQDEERWRARTSKELPFSGAARQAVLLAVQEADALGHRHVHPEHLILALLRATDTGTYQRLREAGVTPESVQHRARQREREDTGG